MTSTSAARSNDPRVVRIIEAFEGLTPADLPRFGDFYAPDADFKDPFNEVRGVPAIQQIFEHMYVALDSPRFVIHDVVAQGDQCVLTWDFIFRFRRFSRELQTVRGASHLKLDAHGLITMHRDYWDVAEELYEKLPGVGVLMRWLKRRANS
ncbi:MAG: nuclear transport factor 2 family protein [Burkholderiales bacterium]